MLDPQTGWLVGVGFSLLVGLGFTIWSGAELGLGAAVIVSCLFPDWIDQEFLGIPFSVRTSVGASAIIAYALRFPWRIKSPLIPLDFAVASLVIVHTASDYYHGMGVMAALRAYGEWALPYVCGRFALRGNNNPIMLGWVICAILVLMSVGAIVETTTKVNVWEAIFGIRDGQFPRDATRYGFKRAFGNTEHSIFFSLQLLLLMPWPIYIWKASDDIVSKTLTVITLLIGVFGCLSTISRTPILILVIIPLLSLAVKFVWARWAAGIALTAVVFVIIQDPVDFAKDSAELTGDKIWQVDINGEKVPYSSGMVRIWLYRVYWPALSDGKLLGHGSHATRTFPVEVPKRPRDLKTLQAFRWVDNGYLLMGLRFGALGIASLVTFWLLSIWTGLSLRADRYWSTMAIYSTATLTALAVMLLTVWLSNDFGFEAFWLAGALGGIYTELRR